MSLEGYGWGLMGISGLLSGCYFVGEDYDDLMEAVIAPIVILHEPGFDEFGDGLAAGFADEVPVSFVVGAFDEFIGDAALEICKIVFAVEAEPAVGGAFLHLGGDDGGWEAGLELWCEDEANLAADDQFPWVEELDVITVNGGNADF